MNLGTHHERQRESSYPTPENAGHTTPLVESGPYGRRSLSFIVQCFELDRRNVSNRLEQSSVVEPVDLLESCELDLFEISPRTVPTDDFGLVEALVHGS